MDSEYNATADNHNTSVDPTPSLDAAYESLLSSRENLFNSGSSNDVRLSEEDTLCNQNLQTSYLFKTLNSKAVVLNANIEKLVDSEKSLEDAVTKIKSSHSTITSLCRTHDNDNSTASIHSKYMELATEYNRTHLIIKKDIHAKRAALEDELDKISIKLNSLRKLIQMGIEDIIKPEDINKKMCPVCFEKEVCMVMIPCGHTYCDACSKYDYRAKCPQCRATINSRVKMYFSI